MWSVMLDGGVWCGVWSVKRGVESVKCGVRSVGCFSKQFVCS